MAVGPVGKGPFYQDDRRDRPLYDTEIDEGEDDKAVPDKEADQAQGYSNHEDDFDSDEFREP